MAAFEQELIAAAKTFGIDKIGIARADVLADERRHLEDWLSTGRHADMLWMEREPDKRSDPRILFPGARTVIACAVNYYTPHDHAIAERLGKISRYAWGEDYHDVLKSRLRELLDWIVERRPDAEGKICVDTAPIMDKAWAVRAGIGWLGKHSNVITTELGSWIFLGEILLTIDLEPTAEIVPDHCGSCTRCLDACPTGAIVEQYVVDARKCISYGTIEFRGEDLPAEIGENLDGWIYGCDVCQEVCPWNRFEQPSGDEAFEPRLGETSLDLLRIREMGPEEYVERFRRSPLKRAKLPGLKRNAAAIDRALSEITKNE